MHSPQTGATPLYIASKENHVDIVGVLLAAGANLDLARQYLMVAEYVTTCVHLCEITFENVCGVVELRTCIHFCIVSCSRALPHVAGFKFATATGT